MSCRYLTSKTRIIPVDWYGNESGKTREVSVPACRLGRPLDETNWAARCRGIAPEGPCWLWAQQHGDQVDEEFLGLAVRSP
ncbi:MAG: hypothetical protein GX495_18875 [Chloroflexi bacterium]|jgi:hypothetical protein|nr:hypothetical protein [Chloroflexota bacterium]